MQISTQNQTTASIQFSITTEKATSFSSESGSEAASNWITGVNTDFSETSAEASEQYSKLFREYILTEDDQMKMDTSTTLIQAYGVTTSEALSQYRAVSSSDKGTLVDRHY